MDLTQRAGSQSCLLHAHSPTRHFPLSTLHQTFDWPGLTSTTPCAGLPPHQVTQTYYMAHLKHTGLPQVICVSPSVHIGLRSNSPCIALVGWENSCRQRDNHMICALAPPLSTPSYLQHKDTVQKLDSTSLTGQPSVYPYRPWGPPWRMGCWTWQTFNLIQQALLVFLWDLCRSKS